MAHALDITEGTQNGVRLNILLFNGGTERLRHLFDSHIPPSNLQQFLKAKELDIKKLLRKHIINKSQKDKLYPPVGLPSSRNFDISLLYTLLRNFCGLPSPTTGWGSKPSPTDRSVEGAVEMIHCYRNIYGHPSTVEIDEKQFESAWKEISEAMKVLGEDATRIESLKEAPFLPSNCVDRLAKFDFTAEVNYHASKHHPGTRQWVFNHVDIWFLDRGSDSRVLIITGNAGMGKSVIAAQICKAMRQRGLLGGLHFCQHNNQRRRKPELMLQSLAKHLCDSLPAGFKDILTGQLASVSAKELASMNVEELFTLLLQEPTNMMDDPGKNILLVVDGLDECEYDGRNRLLDVIISQFHKLPSWIKFLVTGRPENAMADKLAHMEPFVLCARDSNNEKDIELFFRDRLTGILANRDVTDNVHRFVDQADGLMLYAHYFIQFVEDHHETLTPADVGGIFPRGIASVYEEYFDRLEMSLGVQDGPFHDFLASLAASRSPLPVTMASRILGLCLDFVDGNSRQIQQISGSISSLLPTRDACIDVFHKSIIDWLSCPELYGHHRFSVDVSRGDAVLSTECQTTYAAIENRHDVLAEYTAEEKYALQHGIYHSIASARDDETQRNKLFRYGCSLELLHAKLQSNVCDVFSVIEELQSIKQVLNLPQVDSLELDDCITCLRRHPYLLMENPKTIFQFLINEAETVAMSLEACSIMHQPKYDLPLRLEVVNRAQSKDPVITKFRCKTNVNCCDVVNSLLVCGCKGGFLRMFSLKTGRELWCCQGDELDVWPEEERCNYCVIVPQHYAVTHGRFDYAVSFDGKSIQLFPENSYTFIDSCVSQDRKRLVTRQTNLTADLLVWDLDTGNLLRRLSEVTKSITCCTISACGQFVISGSFDRGVSVWDLASPDFITQHNAFSDEHPFIIDCINGLEGDSQFVVVNSSKKQSLTICELKTEAFDSSVTTHLHLGSAHRSLGVSSDGGCLYVCGDSQHISCSGLPFTTRIVPVSCATNWEYVKEVDPERVLLRNYDTVYMCHSLESTSTEVMIDRGVQAISFSVDGKHVYVLSKNGMSMYEASSGRLLVGSTTITHANAFALSPTGEDILIQTKNNFDVYDCNLKHQWTMAHPVAHQTFFKYIDDNRVLFLSKKGEVQVWDLGGSNMTRGRTDNSNMPLSECCDAFSFKRNSNNGTVSHYRLLCCDRRGGLRLHDTFKGHTITQKVPKREIAKCCSFSPDGSSVATGHTDGSLRIWDGRRLELKKILLCGGGLIKACAYLVQDFGNVVVSLHDAGVLKVWDAFSQYMLGSMSFESKLRGLVSSPQNAQVCIALEDKIVILNVHRPMFD